MKKTTVILLILFFIFTTIAMAQNKETKKKFKPVSREVAVSKVLTFVNKYFVPNQNAVVDQMPEEVSGLYKIKVAVDKDSQYFYVSKDGALMFYSHGAIDIDNYEKENNIASPQEEKKEDIAKSDKPVVELFIMSLCPYGIRAQKSIVPEINKFGDKVDFKIRYIVGVNGDTIDQVSSMHGIPEVKENARQIAIMKFYPSKIQPYLQKIEESSCLISCGAVKLEDYWKKAAQELKMDVKKIENFAYGPEMISIFKQDEAQVKKYAASASPTLVINGVKTEAIYKGADKVKQTICSVFTNLPTECENTNAK